MTDWKQAILPAIPNAAEDHFLLFPTEDEKWRLPSFDVAEYDIDLHLFQRRLRQELNADMTVSRWLGRNKEEGSDINRFWIIALMENHNAAWTIPAGAKWFDAQSLETVLLVDEWQREPLLNGLKELKEESPALRPAWYRKGWFQNASQWIQRELEAQDYQLITSIEQFKHWGLSALLRIETNKGLVFFKIANNFPLFANEPKIMDTLAQLFPDLVPRPIAINAAERWMLMADFGTPVRESNPSKELLMRMARDFARLQQKTISADLQTTLEIAGCFNRRLTILEQQIELMFLDEASYAALDAEEMSAWKTSRPKLIALCHALSRYKIPETLVHGDFHGGNVAFRGDEMLIFDWTDACISHPFFDLPVFIDFDGGEFKDELRQAYLAEWLDYGAMETLEEIYRLAELGASLHQVISYQGIRNGIEAEYQASWAGAVVYFIRKIMKGLPELSL